MVKKKINIDDYRVDELHLKIPIKNKKGIYSNRIIKIENVYKYNLTSSGLSKKTKESLQKIIKKSKEQTKQQIRRIKEKDYQERKIKDFAKDIDKRLKVERQKDKIREEKLSHAKEEKLKLSKSEIKKSKFNYHTVNHTGYKYERHLDYIIDEDTTLREMEIIKNDIIIWVKDKYTSMPNHLRMNYVKLEYEITSSGNQMDDINIRESSTSTKISSYKALIPRLKMIIDEIFALAINYDQINIYKQTFVNYDFNSVIY